MSRLSRLAQMLDLQVKFNGVALPTWRTAPPAFSRAVWIECAEIMECHTGWKWWKAAPKADATQAHIELVDIWHFLMSWHLVTPAARVQELLPPAAGSVSVDVSAIEAIEVLALAALAGDLGRATASFWFVCELFGLNFEQLHRLYIGKNALNHHRSLFGYKTGGYEKMWDGREDNAHLAEIMGAGVVEFDAVVSALAHRYRSIFTAAA